VRSRSSESKERSTEEQRTDDERQSRLEDAAAATVTRRGKISGRFTRIGTRGRDQDRRRFDKDGYLDNGAGRDALSLSSVQWQGERKQIRHVFKYDTDRVWQVGSLANGAAEWQKLSLNDLSY